MASKTNTHVHCVFFSLALLCLCSAGCGTTAVHTPVQASDHALKVRSLSDVLHSGGSVFRFGGTTCVEWVARPARDRGGGQLTTLLIDDEGFRHGVEYRHVPKKAELVLAGGGKTPVTRKAQYIDGKWGIIGVARMCYQRVVVRRLRLGVYLVGKEHWFMTGELCRTRTAVLATGACSGKVKMTGEPSQPSAR